MKEPEVEESTTKVVTHERQTAIREQLLAMSGYRCMSCRGIFDPERLELHHTDPVEWGTPMGPANTVVVCSSCHGRFHTEAHDS